MANFLALFMGADGAEPPTPATMAPERMAEGMAAWGQWMADHAGVLVEHGGPLGKTKAASRAGISDVRNNVAGYVVVSADSHEDAVKMFENHPHFAIFPGDRVEVMQVMPIPGAA